METIPVDVRRVGGRGGGGFLGTTPDLDADLERARTLAKLLDSQFSFMGIPFGLDTIVGLVPVVGDTLTALAATYPIWVAQRHGLGRAVQMRMAANIMIDWVPGMVPLVGDLLDMAYKANLKNVKLLEAAVEKKRRKDARAAR